MRFMLFYKTMGRYAFDEILTPEKFADMVFSLIISAFIRQNYDSSVVLEMVKRMVYP